MKNTALTAGVLAAVLLAACSTPKRGGLFAKRTPHEQYGVKLSEAGLKETALGGQWFNAAEKALATPRTITLPYRETGYFEPEQPVAAGYTFAVKRGEKLEVQITVKPPEPLLLFADLWQPAAGSTPSYITSADTTTRVLQHEVEQDGKLILRIQPELLRGGEYTLTVNTGPTLAFPVPSSANPKIGSFWGASRDKGARSHEGVDIFGKLRTPVVAAADGYITRTGENNLGGKVVFLRPAGRNYSLYYAHLDSQLVREGQQVKTGETVGLMGNTGNARNTPTHLHFGIYTGSGAVDPLPFIQTGKKEPAAVSAPLDLLTANVRTNNAVSLRAEPAKNSAVLGKLPVNQVVKILAAAGNWYRVVLPDDREGFVESNAVTAKPYKKQPLKQEAALLDAPDSTAGIKRRIPSGENIAVIGVNNGYSFVLYDDQQGWLRL